MYVPIQAPLSRVIFIAFKKNYHFTEKSPTTINGDSSERHAMYVHSF